ncbi:hypothetical protein ACIP6V_23940 [Streptomyces sp. NPDC088770]|uniref:hypothetical protein n=1 Tax=unclassified Streptomyces TaxID=2593676 RepID=UPI002DD7F280|nr:hypothetical protein [Streptomyces sp. NBC_01788]WSB29730.1 hypothetical protein OIE49_29710 [Streptomyces sp. NBC_01788]
MIIKLTVQGAVYEVDAQRLLLAEARELKTYTGFTPPRWFEALDDADPDATAYLIYLAKKRAGEALRYSDLDSLDYADIELDIIEPGNADGESQGEAAAAGEGAAGAGPDPTPASGQSGTIPSDGTGSTSVPSPTASSTPQPTLAP